jgi:hypothetical protein
VKVVTPLPADAHVVAPSNDVPRSIAAFSGTWAGRYASGGAASQEIALVVERIRRAGAAYRASVIFSWDTVVYRFEPPFEAAYQRYEVAIGEDGALRLRGRDLALHTFRVTSDETLSAEQEDSRSAGYRRVYGVLWRVTPSSP